MRQKQYKMDFTQHAQWGPKEKLILREFLANAFHSNSSDKSQRYLPAYTSDGKNIIYSFYCAGTEIKLTLSNDLLRAEEDFSCFIVDRVSLGGGIYGTVHSSSLGINFNPYFPISFFASKQAVKFSHQEQDPFAELEVDANNRYRLGDKGEKAWLIPAEKGQNSNIIVMPLHNGQNLQTIKMAELTFKERLHIFKGIIEELAIAHKKGLIHRDLKKDNINYAGNFGKITILDWGLSTHKSETDKHHLMGALGHRPPEVVSIPPKISFEADIYSVGPIFLELLGATQPLAKRLEAYNQNGLMAMAEAPLDCSGIYEGFVLPPYFENLKEIWQKTIFATGDKNPEKRPGIEKFQALMEELNSKESTYPAVIQELKEFFELIQFLLQSEFLSFKVNLKKENFSSIENYYYQLSELGVNEKKVGTFSRLNIWADTPTFEMKAAKIVNDIFLHSALIQKALKNCKIDKDELIYARKELEKHKKLVLAIQTTWHAFFILKFEDYFKVRNLKSYESMHKIIFKEDIPMSVKLDLISNEAKGLLKEKKNEANAIFYRLANMQASLDSDRFYDSWKELEGPNRNQGAFFSKYN